MAVKTIPFKELMKQSEDLFETVIVLAKRARQINELWVAQHPLPTIAEGEETFEETPEDEEQIEWDKVNKSTTLALGELVDDSIDYRYTNKVDKEESKGEIQG